MAYAEMAYGKPIKEVILEMLNSGATMIATANRLGVNKQALYAWMDKLNIKKKVVWR
jgi:transposase-like protein